MLKKFIVILSLILALFILWILYQKFVLPGLDKVQVTVEYQKIDPGRLVLGKKISIRDGVKIPVQKYVVIQGSTPTVLGKIDLGLADNLYRKINETVYIEEGYFTEQILSTEKFDTIVEGKTIGSHLRIQLPLPDTVQCFGMQSREESFAPFFIGFLPSSHAKAQLDTIKMKLIQDGYQQWKNEWLRSLQENLEYTARSITNYLNEAARISQAPKFSTITSVFDFDSNGQHYHVEIQCDISGSCNTTKREVKPTEKDNPLG